ncbi:hypothetical protein TRIP_C20289 [Candidatus Zixiibacteriota bacterium]|nr:hypothetical protein TRIP_C20289 [candidate division Zixibacteria bacterium]
MAAEQTFTISLIHSFRSKESEILLYKLKPERRFWQDKTDFPYQLSAVWRN